MQHTGGYVGRRTHLNPARSNLKAAALVDRLAYKLPEAEVETLGRTLRDAKGRPTNRDVV